MLLNGISCYLEMWLQVNCPSHLPISYSSNMRLSALLKWSSLPTCSPHTTTLQTLNAPFIGGNQTRQMKCIRVQVGFIWEYHRQRTFVLLQVKKHFLFIALSSPDLSSHTVCTISKKLPFASIFVTSKHWQLWWYTYDVQQKVIQKLPERIPIF